MRPRDWKVRIEDMLVAISRIQRYLQDLPLESFTADEKTIQAVERNFEILGEAARAVPPEIQSRYPAVPWSRVIGMRNLVAHDYSAISPAVLWETAEADLPGLTSLLSEILKKTP